MRQKDLENAHQAVDSLAAKIAVAAEHAEELGAASVEVAELATALVERYADDLAAAAEAHEAAQAAIDDREHAAERAELEQTIARAKARLAELDRDHRQRLEAVDAAARAVAGAAPKSTTIYAAKRSAGAPVRRLLEHQGLEAGTVAAEATARGQASELICRSGDDPAAPAQLRGDASLSVAVWLAESPTTLAEAEATIASRFHRDDERAAWLEAARTALEARSAAVLAILRRHRKAAA